MYRTCARLDPGFLPTVFFLAIVTCIKVTKTITSFLTSKTPNTYLRNVSFYYS